MNTISRIMSGKGLFARAARGSTWVAFGYVASQFFRLLSNLVLTRLLFPDAFGLMSLVAVIMTGVVMLSDVGVGISVAQNKRGDERDFLDTAWTIQVIRGVVLWVLVCILAWPISAAYSEPALLYMLPVAGLMLVVGGFTPIRVETAGRHLLLGRLTVVELLSQVLGLLVTILLAWLTRSVWALVFGNIITVTIKLLLSYVMLPGEQSRFRLNRADASEIVNFGKWIIPSTAFGFMLAQGDRIILGLYLSLEMLGVYNIGQFLATAPMLLASAVTGRILLPLYREYAERPDESHKRKLRLMRFALTGSIMGAQIMIALLGHPLVGVMYDERYAHAAAIVVLVGVGLLPQLIGMTYDRGALAAGDGRNFFLVIAFRGTIQTVAFVIGAELYGIVGAIAAQCIAGIIGHFSLIWLSRKYHVWDALHDAVFAVIALLLGSLVIYLNFDLISALAAAQAETAR